METQQIAVNGLEEISNFIFTSKYARYSDSKKRRETWDEAVSRVEGMHLDKYSFLAEEDKEEIKKAFDLVREKRIIPSMRSMQFAGPAVLAHNARISIALADTWTQLGLSLNVSICCFVVAGSISELLKSIFTDFLT